MWKSQFPRNNYPPLLGPSEFPNIHHLKRGDYLSSGGKKIEATLFKKWVNENNIDILDTRLIEKKIYEMFPQIDFHLRDKIVSSNKVDLHTKMFAYKASKPLTFFLPKNFKTMDGLDDDEIFSIAELFRVDIYGNVISICARSKSICAAEFSHFFPHSRGGTTTPIKNGKDGGNIIYVHWKAKLHKKNKIEQFVQPELLSIIPVKKFFAVWKVIPSYHFLYLCLGYDIIHDGQRLDYILNRTFGTDINVPKMLDFNMKEVIKCVQKRIIFQSPLDGIFSLYRNIYELEYLMTEAHAEESIKRHQMREEASKKIQKLKERIFQLETQLTQKDEIIKKLKIKKRR